MDDKQDITIHHNWIFYIDHHNICQMYTLYNITFWLLVLKIKLLLGKYTVILHLMLFLMYNFET